MAEQDSDKQPAASAAAPFPTLEELQHWTFVMGRAQQMMMEHLAAQIGDSAAQIPQDPAKVAASWPGMNLFADPAAIARQQAELWSEGLSIWQRALGFAEPRDELRQKADQDRRFAAPEWRDNPLFDTIRQTYLLVSERLLGSVDAIEGLDPATREKLRFSTRAFVDAMAPSNFALTNPQVLERAIETKGESLLNGLDHMLKDLGKGQLTHSDPEAFEVGRNIAVTPGKVVKQTRLYQLIQYSPTTDKVLETPLIIFPPWINRFYILDLNPKKSFIRWAVDQGLTVFIVSWKSADESLADLTMDDYALAPGLSPAALSREQARPAGRDQHRRNSDRPAQGSDPDLCPGRPGGPYRSAAERLEDHPSFRRPDALRPRRLRPYCRRRQPARSPEIPILDQRGEGRQSRAVHCRRDRDEGKLVARLDRLDPRHLGQGGAGDWRPKARRRQAGGDRGRSGQLCESPLTNWLSSKAGRSLLHCTIFLLKSRRPSLICCTATNEELRQWPIRPPMK